MPSTVPLCPFVPEHTRRGRALHEVDLREHIETPEYSGPTKKGIRFPWDKLADVIGLLKTQAIQMGDERGPSDH